MEKGGTAMVIRAPPVSVRVERHSVHLNTVWWSVKMPLIFHISVVPSAQVYYISCMQTRVVPHVMSLYLCCVAKNPVKLTCEYDGEVYQDGERWNRNGDPCTTCFCESGETFCASQHCVVECENATYLPHICCPICPGIYTTCAKQAHTLMIHLTFSLCRR